MVGDYIKSADDQMSGDKKHWFLPFCFKDRSPGIVITVASEPPDEGPENWTWVLHESHKCSNLKALFLAPRVYGF